MSAPVTVPVVLPNGLWRSGAHLRRAWLRSLSGSDEEALAMAPGELPAERATRVLGRCLVELTAAPGEHRSGEKERGGEELARRLTVGDREALLLHLRRLTFGGTADCVLSCPRAGCEEKMDLALDLSDLLLPPYAEPRPLIEAEVPAVAAPDAASGAASGGEGADPGAGWRVRFRLPTGADLEGVARRLVEEGAEASERWLAERLIESVESVEAAEAVEAAGDGAPSPAQGLPPAVVAALSDLVAEADPQADIRLEMDCTGCGERFESRFDATAFLLDELDAGRDPLYRQVHQLALHYHWSEAQILSLTPGKRRLYLGLLADHLGGGGGLGA